jgi:hypothetical protein
MALKRGDTAPAFKLSTLIKKKYLWRITKVKTW